MKKSLLIVNCSFFIALLVACGGRQKTTETAEKRLFTPPIPPVTMTQEQQLTYMQEHYWDNLDFADTTFIVQTDTTHMLRSFFEFVRLLPPDDPAPIAALMKKAATSKPMLEYFAMLGDRVLFDTSSPGRNDELYIPVLEAVIASPLLDEWEKMAPQSDLKIALQNRVGHLANDFRYTLASGRTGTLYGVKADHTLVFINNPGCPMCREITAGLIASPLVTRLIKENKLKILAIYPDEDLTAWRAHAKEFPATWINGYDAGRTIDANQLYDLRAIPSAYLLDSDKRVIAKDVFQVGHIEYLLDQQERK